MRTTTALATLIAAALLSGCAGTAPGAVPGEAASPGAEPSSTSGGTHLELSLTMEEGGETVEGSLTCPSGEATGYLAARGEAACRDLEVGHEALFPDPERVCTQQYGGPEEAEVTGTYEGRAVDVTVTRTNGCGIFDWDSLGELLQPVG